MFVSRAKWCFAVLAFVGLGSVSIGSAQERDRRPDQGGPGGRGGFQFFGGGMGGGVALLQRTDVQDELELLDDQKKQLTEIRDKSGQKMRDLVASLRGGEGDRREEMRETFRKAAEETQAEVEKVLLPHQSKRLKQLETQMRMRGGLLGGLDRDLGEQLGVGEVQREKLREKARDLESELRKKTAELRKQLQEQLLASLTDDQRKQFNEMIGEPFEFKDEGPGFGGFGGFGGPGGTGGTGARRGGGDRPQNE